MTNEFIPLVIDKVTDNIMLEKSKYNFECITKRRTVREFSSKPIPKEVIENILKSASCAPSGANKQPWFFCVVTNADLKIKIRDAAEKEEIDNYTKRMSQEWLEELKQFGTTWEKPFLEIAPALIVVFKKVYDTDNGTKKNNYYVSESVGLACGFLLQAIHNCGLVSLTHTPSPLNFLAKILDRPENEKPFLLIPIGYPAENAKVPNIKRKSLEQISVFLE